MDGPFVYHLVEGEGRFEVGYWKPDRTWSRDSSFADQVAAAERCAFLNGALGGDIFQPTPLPQFSVN
jgi:hypothetical protein